MVTSRQTRRLAGRCQTLRLPLPTRLADSQSGSILLVERCYSTSLCSRGPTNSDSGSRRMPRSWARCPHGLCAWSSPGRLRSEAAFARLAGAAPIPASSGQTVRFRLDRGGDRQLNRALHMIVLSRLAHHPETKRYAARRTAEGKTPREIKRCLKRHLARHLFRLLESSPTPA